MRQAFNFSNLRVIENIYFIASIFFTFAVLYFYYDQFWYPPDDGAYAHVAGRILNGDVLNLDVHDVHMGYINFLHAGALKLFGSDMASLRIPLVVLGILQSAIIFTLMKPKGLAIALICVAVISSLSFIQFLNPTANWYGLFLTILAVFSLEKIPEDSKYKYIIVGYILLTLFLFRQLSGVITSMGVLTYILYCNREEASLGNAILSKLIFAIMAFGLAMYLYLKTPMSAFLLFGIWPALIVLYGFLFASVSNAKTIKLLLKLSVGGALALAPLFIYHFYHGSIASWYNDTVISALMLTDLSFIQKSSFLDYLIYSMYSVAQLSSVNIVLNGLYWICLILASTVLGLIVFLKVYAGQQDRFVVSALPMVAMFYGLISVHYQIPIYLYYTVGFALCGIVCVMNLTKPIVRNLMILLLSSLSFIAINFHAAQPLERSVIEILQGKKVTSEKTFLDGNVNLWVTEKDARIYEYIRDLVDENVAAEETIFAFPSNSEIYFITDRKNPFRFFNSSFGISNERQFDQILETLKSSPPRMVFYSPDDKYNTDNAVKISRYIKDNYKKLETVNGIEYYLLQ